MSKRVQAQDRHEHGGLPDTVRVARHFLDGYVRQDYKGDVIIRTSGKKTLAQAHIEEEGHVTVTCHCPRCEAGRVTECSVMMSSRG